MTMAVQHQPRLVVALVPLLLLLGTLLLSPSLVTVVDASSYDIYTRQQLQGLLSSYNTDDLFAFHYSSASSIGYQLAMQTNDAIFLSYSKAGSGTIGACCGSKPITHLTTGNICPYSATTTLPAFENITVTKSPYSSAPTTYSLQIKELTRSDYILPINTYTAISVDTLQNWTFIISGSSFAIGTTYNISVFSAYDQSYLSLFIDYQCTTAPGRSPALTLESTHASVKKTISSAQDIYLTLTLSQSFYWLPSDPLPILIGYCINPPCTIRQTNRCPNDCSGHGQCSLPETTCVCSPGFTGFDCSLQWNSCIPACDGNYECVDGTCQCKFGYYGSYCERYDTSCLRYKSCYGNGQCVNNMCVCDAFHESVDCSQNTLFPDFYADSSAVFSPTLAALMSTFLLFLVAFLGFLMVVLVRKVKKMDAAIADADADVAAQALLPRRDSANFVDHTNNANHQDVSYWRNLLFGNAPPPSYSALPMQDVINGAAPAEPPPAYHAAVPLSNRSTSSLISLLTDVSSPEPLALPLPPAPVPVASSANPAPSQQMLSIDVLLLDPSFPPPAAPAAPAPAELSPALPPVLPRPPTYAESVLATTSSHHPPARAHVSTLPASHPLHALVHGGRVRSMNDSSGSAGQSSRTQLANLTLTRPANIAEWPDFNPFSDAEPAVSAQRLPGNADVDLLQLDDDSPESDV